MSYNTAVRRETFASATSATYDAEAVTYNRCAREMEYQLSDELFDYFYEEEREVEYAGISKIFSLTAKSATEEYVAIFETRGNLVAVNFPKMKLLKRIRDIASYETGWDGEDTSLPASKKAQDEAENFLSCLPLEKIYPPRISLASDGEINFNWRANGNILDLGFYGVGTYSFYCKSALGEEYFANNIPVDKRLPDSILQIIKK